jgi:hypothetical protein
MAATIQTCRFIDVTDLVPKAWRFWFWQLISENAPFSWGDNNRTMVNIGAFINHCKWCLEDCEETSKSAITRFLNKLEKLDTGADAPYIDLEN